MGDIDIKTATFTAGGMVLDGSEQLSTSYGAYLANNTGWILGRPICLWSCNIPVTAEVGGSPQALLAEVDVPIHNGQWLICCSSAGDFGSGYTGSSHPHHCPNITINGELVVNGQGKWPSVAVTQLFTIADNTLRILVEKYTDNAVVCGYINIHGIRQQES